MTAKHNLVREVEQAEARRRRAVDAERTAQRLRITIAAQLLAAVAPTHGPDLAAALATGPMSRPRVQCRNALLLADMLLEESGAATMLLPAPLPPLPEPGGAA